MDAIALYRAFREQSLDYLRGLPAIEQCETLHAAPAMRRVRWVAKGNVPDAVKAFVKPSDLHWVEETHWDDGTLEARSLIKRPDSDVLHCQSVLRFRPHATGVHVECEGDLKVKIPFVGSLVEYAATRAIHENMGQFFEEFARRAAAASPAPTPSGALGEGASTVGLAG